MSISTQDLIKKVGLPVATPPTNNQAPAPGVVQAPGVVSNQPKTVTLQDLVNRVNAPTPTAPVEQKPGFIQSVIQDIAHPFLKTAVTPYAITKGAIDLSQGNTATANEALTKEYDFGYFGKTKALGAEISPTASTGEVLARGGKEVLGTALEMGSNFIGGEGAVGVGKSLLKSQLKRAVVGGLTEGAKIGALGAAGRSLQDNQTLGETAMNTALGAGAGAAGGALLGVTGVGLKSILTPISTVTQKLVPALNDMAGKIETTVLKPTKGDFQGGFKAENVLKYDLGGTVKDTIEKSTAILKDLRKQATDLRAGSDKTISLNQIVQDTANDVLNNRVGSFGVNKKMETAMNDFVKEMEYISPDGKLTVPQAQEVKEALGTFGSWLYGNRDLDATAQERVANIMYSKVKTAIEKNTPKELAGINKQMSDIIPIKNAAIRRLPVAERNNAIGLGDIISAGAALHNPAGWGITIANQLQKSGRFAQSLYKGSNALRVGAEDLGAKMKGLRISPETLLNRNSALRKTAAESVTTGVVKNADQKVAQEIIPKVKIDRTLKPVADKGIPIPKEILNKKMPVPKEVLNKTMPTIEKTTTNPKLRTQMAPSKAETDPLYEYNNKQIKTFSDGLKGKSEVKAAINDIGGLKNVERGTLDISKLKATENYSPNNEGVQRVMAEIKSGIKVPIVAQKQADGLFDIFDGNHRLAAYKQLGIKDIPVIVEKGTLESNIVAPKLRTTTGAAELAFPKAEKLTPRDRLTETKAIQKFVQNKDKMVNEYIQTNGKVANADEARKLFQDVGYKGYNSAAVQEPSSALNKEVFKKLLKDNPEPYVTVYSGGSGAGKSSAIRGQRAIKAAETKSAAILDGNLSSLKSATDRMKEIADSGKVAKFVYVYRDPIDAFENGVVKRMKFNQAEAGRIVPAKVVAGNHNDSLKVIKTLYENSPAKLRKNFTFLDNSLGKGKVKKMTYEELLKKEIPADLEKQLIDKSKELYANKTINKRELKKYIE